MEISKELIETISKALSKLEQEKRDVTKELLEKEIFRKQAEKIKQLKKENRELKRLCRKKIRQKIKKLYEELEKKELEIFDKYNYDVFSVNRKKTLEMKEELERLKEKYYFCVGVLRELIK